jgi:hypothetical protein
MVQPSFRNSSEAFFHEEYGCREAEGDESCRAQVGVTLTRGASGLPSGGELVADDVGSVVWRVVAGGG